MSIRDERCYAPLMAMDESPSFTVETDEDMGSVVVRATGEIDVAGDDIVRVELDNGFVLWSRADDLVREHGRQSVSRDGGTSWEVDTLACAPATTRDERGLLGLGIKVLDFFGVDLKKQSAFALRYAETTSGRPTSCQVLIEAVFMTK